MFRSIHLIRTEIPADDGAGPFGCCGEPMKIKESKPLPSSG